MEIRSASFVISSSHVSGCPESNLPEYAFIGRSNVGKSSLINMLTNRNKLAKTSGVPGKTRLINHFLIDRTWHLVDLPGYGYAKASKKNKKEFQQMISSYFARRRQLISAFVLIDIRHKPQQIDLNFMQWLGENQIPFRIIFTKSDKLKPGLLDKNITDYLHILGEMWDPVPDYFITSSANRTGKEAVLAYIDHLNQNLE